jgi:hypothetical protein
MDGGWIEYSSRESMVHWNDSDDDSQWVKPDMHGFVKPTRGYSAACAPISLLYKYYGTSPLPPDPLHGVVMGIEKTTPKTHPAGWV